MSANQLAAKELHALPGVTYQKGTPYTTICRTAVFFTVLVCSSLSGTTHHAIDLLSKEASLRPAEPWEKEPSKGPCASREGDDAEGDLARPGIHHHTHPLLTGDQVAVERRISDRRCLAATFSYRHTARVEYPAPRAFWVRHWGESRKRVVDPTSRVH